MKTLALEITSEHIAYAFFDNSLYQEHRVHNLNEFSLPYLLEEIDTYLSKILKDKKITLLVMKKIDTSKYSKELLIIESQIRGIVRLLCAKRGVIFQEYKVDGWFKKITSGKNTYPQKVKLLKRNGIKIDKEEKMAVDLILLADGVVKGNLQISV